MRSLTAAPLSLSALARHPVALPLAAAGLGALAPGAAAVAHAALPLAVPLLVALAVLATEMAPPSRREGGTALLMLLATALLCPLAVVGIAEAMGLPRDLTLAAALVTAAPIGISAGVLSQSLGLPARPVIWAAMLGLLAGPLVLPAAAALCGAAGLIAPWPLAYRAALFGAVPVSAAFAARRAAPRAVAILLPDLGGLVVLALLPLLLAAGGSLRAAAAATASDGAAAAAVSLASLAVSAAVASLVGRLAVGSTGGVSFAVAGAARNASFAWAAAVGMLPARSELVLAVAAIATFAVPVVLRAVVSAADHIRPLGHMTKERRRAEAFRGMLPEAARAVAHLPGRALKPIAGP